MGVLVSKTAVDAQKGGSTKNRMYTAEELLEISTDTTHRYELTKGILTIMSPAGSAHGSLALRIGARIQVHVEEHHLGVAFAAETGFKLESNPDTVLAPDVSFVGQDRIPDNGLPTS